MSESLVWQRTNKMRYSSCMTLIVLLLQLGSLAQENGSTRLQGPLTVADAVNIALKENPMIAASRAEAKAALAEVRSAWAMTMPQISANSYLTAGNSSNIVS